MSYFASLNNVGSFLPPDYGFKAWAYDITGASNSYAQVSGTMFTVRLKLTSAQTITNVHCIVSGSATSQTQGFVAVYQNGTLLGQSANSSTLGTLGGKTIALTSPVSAVAGFIDVGIWSVATTPSSLARSSALSGTAGFLTGTNARYATADTGLTTTAPATLGTKTENANNVWAAVS